MTGYVETDELFRVLKLRAPNEAQTEAGARCIATASFEADSEMGTTYLGGTADVPALLAEVVLERAVEHWTQQELPFGVLGQGEAMPVATAKDSWDRHAHKLAPLKQSWGIS